MSAQTFAAPFAGIAPGDLHIRTPLTLDLVQPDGADTIIDADGLIAASRNGRLLVLAVKPWRFDYEGQYNLKRPFRRTSRALTRLLSNAGVSSETPLLDRISRPVVDDEAAESEPRYLSGFYLDQPQEMDDPYRFFRW